MSVWDEARLGGRVGQKHALGLWHPCYKLASLGWMPPVSQRRKLQGKKRFVYTLNFAFPSNTNGVSFSLSDRFSVLEDFWLTDTIFSSQVLALTQGFNLQLFDSKNEVPYMNMPEQAYDFGGGGLVFNDTNSTIKLPYFHRRITKIPAGAKITAVLSVTITSIFGSSSGMAQLALGGYQ